MTEILKIILVPDFCPLKLETARFSIEFRPLTLRAQSERVVK